MSHTVPKLPAILIAVVCVTACGSVGVEGFLLTRTFTAVADGARPPDTRARDLAAAVDRQMTVQRVTRVASPAGLVVAGIGVALVIARRRAREPDTDETDS